ATLFRSSSGNPKALLAGIVYHTPPALRSRLRRFITCRQGKLSWLFFSLRMGTSAALRAAPMAAFTLLISADAIVNQTASTAFLTSMLSGSSPVFHLVHPACLIFRAKLVALFTVSSTFPLPFFFNHNADHFASFHVQSLSGRDHILQNPVNFFPVNGSYRNLFSVNDPQIILNCLHKILSFYRSKSLPPCLFSRFVCRIPSRIQRLSLQSFPCFGGSSLVWYFFGSTVRMACVASLPLRSLSR